MKKTILYSILLFTTTTFADTTMCFKENHKSLATIENTPLDGGECAGKHSLNDMKKAGWSVADIKISDSNFIYILKKETPNDKKNNNTTISQKELDANISASILANSQKQEAIKKEQEEKERIESAKELYISKCQSCHGEKGEKTKGGTKLNNLSEEKMVSGFKDYILGRDDKASSIFSSLHTNLLSDEKVKDIKKYLDTLN